METAMASVASDIATVEESTENVALPQATSTRSTGVWPQCKFLQGKNPPNDLSYSAHTVGHITIKVMHETGCRLEPRTGTLGDVFTNPDDYIKTLYDTVNKINYITYDADKFVFQEGVRQYRLPAVHFDMFSEPDSKSPAYRRRAYETLLNALSTLKIRIDQLQDRIIPPGLAIMPNGYLMGNILNNMPNIDQVGLGTDFLGQGNGGMSIDLRVPRERLISINQSVQSNRYEQAIIPITPRIESALLDIFRLYHSGFPWFRRDAIFNSSHNNFSMPFDVHNRMTIINGLNSSVQGLRRLLDPYNSKNRIDPVDYTMDKLSFDPIMFDIGQTVMNISGDVADHISSKIRSSTQLKMLSYMDSATVIMQTLSTSSNKASAINAVMSSLSNSAAATAVEPVISAMACNFIKISIDLPMNARPTTTLAVISLMLLGSHIYDNRTVALIHNMYVGMVMTTHEGSNTRANQLDENEVQFTLIRDKSERHELLPVPQFVPGQAAPDNNVANRWRTYVAHLRVISHFHGLLCKGRNLVGFESLSTSGFFGKVLADGFGAFDDNGADELYDDKLLSSYDTYFSNFGGLPNGNYSNGNSCIRRITTDPNGVTEGSHILGSTFDIYEVDRSDGVINVLHQVRSILLPKTEGDDEGIANPTWAGIAPRADGGRVRRRVNRPRNAPAAAAQRHVNVVNQNANAAPQPAAQAVQPAVANAPQFMAPGERQNNNNQAIVLRDDEADDGNNAQLVAQDSSSDDDSDDDFINDLPNVRPLCRWRGFAVRLVNGPFGINRCGHYLQKTRNNGDDDPYFNDSQPHDLYNDLMHVVFDSDEEYQSVPKHWRTTTRNGAILMADELYYESEMSDGPMNALRVRPVTRHIFHDTNYSLPDTRNINLRSSYDRVKNVMAAFSLVSDKLGGNDSKYVKPIIQQMTNDRFLELAAYLSELASVTTLADYCPAGYSSLMYSSDSPIDLSNPLSHRESSSRMQPVRIDGGVIRMFRDVDGNDNAPFNLFKLEPQNNAKIIKMEWSSIAALSLLGVAPPGGPDLSSVIDLVYDAKAFNHDIALMKYSSTIYNRVYNSKIHPIVNKLYTEGVSAKIVKYRSILSRVRENYPVCSSLTSKVEASLDNYDLKQNHFYKVNPFIDSSMIMYANGDRIVPGLPANNNRQYYTLPYLRTRPISPMYPPVIVDGRIAGYMDLLIDQITLIANSYINSPVSYLDRCKSVMVSYNSHKDDSLALSRVNRQEANMPIGQAYIPVELLNSPLTDILWTYNNPGVPVEYASLSSIGDAIDGIATGRSHRKVFSEWRSIFTREDPDGNYPFPYIIPYRYTIETGFRVRWGRTSSILDRAKMFDIPEIVDYNLQRPDIDALYTTPEQYILKEDDIEQSGTLPHVVIPIVPKNVGPYISRLEARTAIWPSNHDYTQPGSFTEDITDVSDGGGSCEYNLQSLGTVLARMKILELVNPTEYVSVSIDPMAPYDRT